MSIFSYNPTERGTASESNEYPKKPNPATLTPVLAISAVVLITLPALASLPALAVAVAHLAAPFRAALAAFPAPKVKTPTTSSTTEAPPATPLIHLSVVDNSPAIPSPVIEVHTS